MSEYVSTLIREITLREVMTSVVDILVVYYVIYRALLLVKGTRAAQMLTGLVLFGGGFYLANLFELSTLLWLLDNLINYSIIFFIVIFQQDIRRALTRVGGSVFSSARQYEETFVFEEVIRAAEKLSRSRMGALIVLARDAELDEFFGDPGELIDGRVSQELLVALFLADPRNTVHDGAVVIKNLRVQRAGCVLPLSANRKLDKSLGTRHRAAIGITEETDAVVVVVSEERGSVSLCFGGNIASDLDTPTLRKALLGLFQKEKRPAARPVNNAGKAQRSGPREPSATQKFDRDAAAPIESNAEAIGQASPSETEMVLVALPIAPSSSTPTPIVVEQAARTVLVRAPDALTDPAASPSAIDPLTVPTTVPTTVAERSSSSLQSVSVADDNDENTATISPGKN